MNPPAVYAIQICAIQHVARTDVTRSCCMQMLLAYDAISLLLLKLVAPMLRASVHDLHNRRCRQQDQQDSFFSRDGPKFDVHAANLQGAYGTESWRRGAFGG